MWVSERKGPVGRLWQLETVSHYVASRSWSQVRGFSGDRDPHKARRNWPLGLRSPYEDILKMLQSSESHQEIWISFNSYIRAYIVVNVLFWEKSDFFMDFFFVVCGLLVTCSDPWHSQVCSTEQPRCQHHRAWKCRIRALPGTFWIIICSLTGFPRWFTCTFKFQTFLFFFF